MRDRISLTIAASFEPGSQARADHLNRAAHAGQRVLHFVGDHGRHLAEPREGGLLAQLLLDARRAR